MASKFAEQDVREILRSIDLVGLTLCLENETRTMSPEEVRESLVLLLGGVRGMIAEMTGVEVDCREVLRGSPAEAAERILRDLDGN